VSATAGGPRYQDKMQPSQCLAIGRLQLYDSQFVMTPTPIHPSSHQIFRPRPRPRHLHNIRVFERMIINALPIYLAVYELVESIRYAVRADVALRLYRKRNSSNFVSRRYSCHAQHALTARCLGLHLNHSKVRRRPLFPLVII